MLYVGKGDLQAAYTLRKSLYAAQLGRTGKPAQPSNLVDLALRLGKTDEARTLLSDYLAKHPNDFEIRRRLRDLSGSDEKHWWSDYDPNVSDIDTSHFDNAHYPSANHAWIVDFTNPAPGGSTSSRSRPSTCAINWAKVVTLAWIHPARSTTPLRPTIPGRSV